MSHAPARAIGYASAALGLQVFWATLVVFVPPMLERLGAAPLTIGLVMACDPAAMILIMPLAGLASDRLRTRLGGRLPFMIASAAFASVAMVALGRSTSVAMAAALAALTCIASAAYWAPYRAVLADAFPAEDQAMTSAYQSLARELGTLLIFTLGAFALAWGAGRVFDLAAAALLVTTLWCVLAVARRAGSPAQTGGPSQAPGWHRKVPTGSGPLRVPLPAPVAAEPVSGLRAEIRHLPRRLLAAQMLWWFAIEAATVFAVLYIVHDVLGVHDLASAAGQAAMGTAIGALAVLAVAGVVASVPVAHLAGRFGKLSVVRGGLAALLAASALATVATGMPAVYAVAVLFGVGLAVVQVLAYPMLLDLRPRGGGALASAYNLLIAVPQLFALVAMGAIAQATGTYRVAFALGAVAVLGALWLLRGPLWPQAAAPSPEAAALAEAA
jgi:MFS family permease